MAGVGSVYILNGSDMSEVAVVTTYQSVVRVINKYVNSKVLLVALSQHLAEFPCFNSGCVGCAVTIYRC